MSFDPAASFLEESLRTLRGYKRLAEDAFAQLTDDDFFRHIDPEANSIAMLVKHVSGNMRSRWTDFLTSDGEKPNRHRDHEFIIEPGTTRGQVMTWWEAGWKCVFDAIGALKPDDLGRTVYIAGKEHTVLQAITRQVTHYASHIGQIVLLAKHFRGAQWKSLSIPRGQSETYARKFEEELAKRRTAS